MSGANNEVNCKTYMTYFRPDGSGGLELVVCKAGPHGRDVTVPVNVERATWHLKSLADFVYQKRGVR